MYKKIKITFKNGESTTFEKDDWDDYSFTGDSVIVKKQGAWIAIFNFDVVYSVELI